MWFKEFKDYPIDKPLKKETISTESGKTKGFCGVEMKELNGWGHSYDLPLPHKKGRLTLLFQKLKKRIFG